MPITEPLERRRGRGFTLIELLMVIVLIAIVTAVALPRINLSKFRSDAAGRLVRMVLQSSDRNAITRQSNVIVSFDMTYNRLRVVQDYNNNDTLNTNDLVQFRPLEEGAHFATPTFAGVSGTVPTAAVTGAGLITVSGMQSVVFRRDGSASTAVEIYVTVRDAKPDEYRAILMAANTGKTDLYKYNGSAWIKMTQ